MVFITGHFNWLETKDNFMKYAGSLSYNCFVTLINKANETFYQYWLSMATRTMIIWLLQETYKPTKRFGDESVAHSLRDAHNYQLESIKSLKVVVYEIQHYLRDVFVKNSNCSKVCKKLKFSKQILDLSHLGGIVYHSTTI